MNVASSLPTHPFLGKLGLTPAGVRAALGLPPLPERAPTRREFNYVTADDRERRLQEVEEAVPLMIGLALAGVRAQGVQGIASVCACSPSAVKRRLREAGVSNPKGKPVRVRVPSPVIVKVAIPTSEPPRPNASIGGLLEDFDLFKQEKAAESLDCSGL